MMNSYKFSATTTGFSPVSMLDSCEQVGTLPEDLVDVSNEDYTTYTGPAPEGKTRGSNKKGQPAWGDIPSSTPEQQRSQAAYRKQNDMAEASAVITPLQDALDTGIATDDETRQLTAWKMYRALLSRINPGDAAGIKWPDKPS